MLIRHAKARGEWAELRFMTRATELGLRVTKPWGDNAPYDLAVETHGRFLRVQVKCTRFRRGRSYKCHLDHNGHYYRPDQIDFIAAYVIPAGTWYILPIEATKHQPDILLTPDTPPAQNTSATKKPGTCSCRGGRIRPYRLRRTSGTIREQGRSCGDSRLDCPAAHAYRAALANITIALSSLGNEPLMVYRRDVAKECIPQRKPWARS